MQNIFQMIGKMLVAFYTAEATVTAGGCSPDKTDFGTLNGRPVGLIGVVGYADDATVVAAIQAAAIAAYPPNGKAGAAPPTHA